MFLLSQYLNNFQGGATQLKVPSSGMDPAGKFIFVADMDSGASLFAVRCSTKHQNWQILHSNWGEMLAAGEIFEDWCFLMVLEHFSIPDQVRWTLLAAGENLASQADTPLNFSSPPLSSGPPESLNLGQPHTYLLRAEIFNPPLLSGWWSYELTTRKIPSPII